MLQPMSKLEKARVRAPDASKTAEENWLQHIIKAGGYSLAGIGAVLRHEMAFRIEAACLAFLLPMLVVLPVGLGFKAMILASMLLVLIVELLNSALEWIVDYISLERHPYAKRAKDMGSAAVMLTLVNSGAIWLLAILEWRGL